MNRVKKILVTIIFLFVIPSYITQSYVARDCSYVVQQEKYPLKHGRPTTIGINYYAKKNEKRFLSEFQELVKDSIYSDVYITVDDIRKYTDEPDVLGYCITSPGSSEIVIDNQERYIAYEYSMLSSYQKSTTVEANNFVKGVIFHELTHNYFAQVMLEMRQDSMFVSPEYNNFNMIPRNSFGSNFVEEGVAVYVTVKKGEEIFGKDFIPESIDQIRNKEYKYYVMYNYSCVFVRPILDKYGIKKGMELIIGNKPPTYEEMMNPEKYYDRLK